MKKILIICLLVLSTACATRNTGFMDYNGLRTYDGISKNYPEDAKLFAELAQTEIKKRYPSLKTSFQLFDLENSVFMTSFEEALRQAGYGISITSTPNNLSIGYVLDKIKDENKAYLQVEISDGSRFGFVQKLSAREPLK